MFYLTILRKIRYDSSNYHSQRSDGRKKRLEIKKTYFIHDELTKPPLAMAEYHFLKQLK